MTLTTGEILDLPIDVRPDPGEYLRAAMEWHFNPQTGSPFWLRRAETLDFDPRSDVNTLEDLRLFPNVTAELRDVRVEDLIPRGYAGQAQVLGIYESGGTTGAPKRVVQLADWSERSLAWNCSYLDAYGVERGLNWLGIVPTGPHSVGAAFQRTAMARGGLAFCVDLDPRWVKRLIAAGRVAEAGEYAEHIIEQAAFVLHSQDIGAMFVTPPLLERLARRDDLVDLINEKVRFIRWGGTQMDADSRYLYRTEIFPNTTICGSYGSTMFLGGACERPGLSDDDPCVFDPPSPYVTFSVVDPDSLKPVEYGERGQVVVSHVTRSFLLPNNLERDIATRIEPLDGHAGDCVADVAPVAQFENAAVIEGVY